MPKQDIFRWTKTYDIALFQIKKSYEHANWPDVAARVEGLLRSWDAKIQRFPIARQCRDRWIENLDPSFSREPLTKKEIKSVFRMKAEGSGYAEISRTLNHPPNQIKCVYISKKRRGYKLRAEKSLVDHQNSVSDSASVTLADDGVSCSSDTSSSSDSCVSLRIFRTLLPKDQRFFAKPPLTAEPPLATEPPLAAELPSIELDPEYTYSDLGELAQEIIEQTQFKYY
jgi:hypothetical protein